MKRKSALARVIRIAAVPLLIGVAWPAMGQAFGTPLPLAEAYARGFGNVSFIPPQADPADGPPPLTTAHTPTDPSTAHSPVAPALPADPAYHGEPYVGALTTPPAPTGKRYPPCTATLRDACRNPARARAYSNIQPD